MSKPATNEQGVPVRRGAYDYETKRGKLQDVNQDNQVSFADTWIGDMLGMDGQGGVQGPSMRDSMGGARRRAIQMMQEQGVPMTQANLARAMNRPGGSDGAGAPSDLAQPGTVMHEDQPITTAPLDEGGGMAGPLAAAATGAVAAAAAARLFRGKPLQPDETGRVLVPVDGDAGNRLQRMTPQEAVDAGWAVVGLNYADGRNALPAPSRSPAIDYIDGTAEDVTDGGGGTNGAGGNNPRPRGGGSGTGTAANPTPDAPNAGPVAGDVAAPGNGGAVAPPESAPISTEDIMNGGSPASNASNAPEGFRPAKLPADARQDAEGVYTTSDPQTRTQTAYVQGADGSWYSQTTQATPSALRAQREAISRALKSIR